MGDVERVEHLGLGDAIGAALDHQDRLVGAGDDQVHLELRERLLVGVDDEVAVELADAHGADVLGDRDRRDRERRGGAVHREDVVGVDVVDRHRLGDELRLEVPALREEGPDRPVDHARGQGRLLARPRLAAEERAGDLAGRVVLLLDVDGQREEVHIAEVAHRRGAEDHRVAGLDDDGAARLAGELAGLERDLLAADLGRDTGHVKHAHVFVFSFRQPGWLPAFPEPFRSLTGGMLQGHVQWLSVAKGRRGSGDAGPDPAREVALNPLCDRIAPAIPIEAGEVEAELLGAPPEVRIVLVALIGVERVDHRPEGVRTLQGRRLGGCVERG